MLALVQPVAGGGELMLRLLPQLVLLIAVARLGGFLLGRLGQPQVVGEIAAGLLLGPSVFGRVAPEQFAVVFGDGAHDPVLAIFGQFGLVFLTLLMGMEFDFGHLRSVARTATAVALGGIALPFALGLPLAWLLHKELQLTVPLDGMALFLCTALSITSIPVLGRILVEFGLTRTRFGVVTMTAAGLDDALGWILLAAVSALVRGVFEPGAILTMLAATLGFVAVVLLVVRPLLVRWLVRTVERDGGLTLATFSLLLLTVLLCALVTEAIGIFALFGSFVLGASLWDQAPLRRALATTLQPFVTAFFLPVFFAYTGLRTDVGLLHTGQQWLLCGLLLLAACAGKIVGCGGAARMCGMSWRESGCVGVLMNTRALMGLVAINVGRELGVIDGAVFTMLVLMAIVTTFLTTPLLRRLIRDQPPCAN